MRADFVFLLFALLACCSGIASAERAVKVNALHSDSIEASISSRNLRGTAASDEERLGNIALGNFAERVMGIFNRKPSLAKQAEKLQKSPSTVKALEQATLTEKSSNNLRAYFSRLSANSSKKEKFFIIATIVLFAAGIKVTWL
ncbi:putative secreted RxLR effector protein [Phytophthora cinnamomi]|uniref:putative secreted RxLR effector protein n=1 Tax=Phytophthora cinnamomi TaxID=4785 RepID=UPI002A2F65E4|nr:putative secreted RxLR effector protein [Phytophthora cinnamomi]KAJ8544242.1 hypothetical protein ON010_g12027 [Phytophthora cinnamomi]QVE55565.1 RxLR effector protein 66 [Phytophthora cinnamomi]